MDRRDQLDLGAARGHGCDVTVPLRNVTRPRIWVEERNAAVLGVQAEKAVSVSMATGWGWGGVGWGVRARNSPG